MQRPEPGDIPLCPGVYIYKDKAGRIIYVGKAAVLRKRVLSYFREKGLPPKTRAMMRRAASLETLPTATEKEALLLEAGLIKQHRPHYNIVLRDDKQYLLFRLDLAQAFPRLEIVRNAKQRGGARLFGPYVSALAARSTWKAAHAAFPLRRCTDRAFKNRSRPCLYHYMGRCPAPCVGLITAEAYAELTAGVEALLSGRSGELVERLERDMAAAAEALEFERAAALRDQIRAVRRTLEHQAAVLPGDADLDVLGLAHAEHGLGLGILFVRGGRLLGGRAFFQPGLDSEDAGDLLAAFPAQFYSPESDIPPRLLFPWLPASGNPLRRDTAPDIDFRSGHGRKESTPVTKISSSLSDDEADRRTESAESKHSAEDIEQENDIALLEQALSDLRGASVRIQVPRGRDEQRLMDMACLHAREEAARRQHSLPRSLAGALELPEIPRRIECVDVSHTGGTAARVGMVVFEDGRPLKSAYRAYIAEDCNGDDHAALRAWVPRRLESGPPWPDLLLIDGGRGQLATVQRALEQFAFENGALLRKDLPANPCREIGARRVSPAGGRQSQRENTSEDTGRAPFPLAALAKAREDGKTDRRAGNVADRIFLPGRSNPLPLKPGSPELLFLQHIRDTAHRFALGAHRKARAKETLGGELGRVPGIGPATARLLLQRFDSLEAMRKATPAELEAIPGIGARKAASLAAKLKIIGV